MKKVYPGGLVLVFVLALCFSVISGCDSDSDSLSPPAANISGTWDSIETTIADECESPLPPPLVEVITIVQADGSNTVTTTFDEGTPNDTSDDTILDLTMSGNKLTYSGTFLEVDASIAVTLNATVDVSSTPYTLAGTITWVATPTGSLTTCSGNSTITATMR